MRYHKFFASVLFFALFVIDSAVAGDGVISMQSPRGVDETAARLEKVLNEKGLTVFARIDHDKNAEKAGLELRPTRLFVFGNPKVGTPLILCNQEAAIDLPRKMLVRVDGAGRTWLSYNDPKYIAGRYGMGAEGCAEAVTRIENALGKIAYETIAP